MKYLLVFLAFYSLQVIAQEPIQKYPSDSVNGAKIYDLVLEMAKKHDDVIKDSLVVVNYPNEYFSYVEKAEVWANAFGNEKQKVKIKFLLVKYYFMEQNYENVIRIGRLILYDKYLSPKDQLELFDFLLSTYFKLSAYEQYLDLIPLKYKLAKQFSNADVFNSEYADVANVYIHLKQYELARKNYRLGILQEKEDNNLFAAASLTNNIGLTFAKTYEWDSALFYYNKAIAMAEKSYFKDAVYKQYFIGIIKSNIAQIALHKGDYLEVIPFIKNEIKYSILKKEFSIAIEGYNNMANVYLLKNEPRKSLLFVDSAIQLHKKGESIVKYMKSIELKGKALLLMGQPQEANQVFNRYQFINDSLIAESNKQSLETGAIIYETNKKEDEIRKQKVELSDKNKIIIQKNEESRTLLWSLVVSLLLIGVIIYFLIYMRNSKKTIEIRKEQLSQALLQQEYLLKEVHHRVKNNLQVVSGLLLLQANETTSTEVKEMMKQGQLRIESMSLVHQMLYKKTNFKSVRIKAYLNELLNNLASSYAKNSKVKLSVNVEDVLVNIDKVIPLGLITTEVVSNSFKHAFLGNKGKIEVSLKKVDSSTYKYVIKDDGKGFDSNFNYEKSTTLGLKLVKMLSKELRAKIDIDGNNGTEFILYFNMPKI